DFHVTGVQTCALPIEEKEFPYISMKINKVTSTGRRSSGNAQSITAHITLQIAGYADHDYIENALITKTKNHLTLSAIHSVLMTRSEERRVGKGCRSPW